VLVVNDCVSAVVYDAGYWIHNKVCLSCAIVLGSLWRHCGMVGTECDFSGVLLRNGHHSYFRFVYFLTAVIVDVFCCCLFSE
jgi:hypothetical protein